MRDLSEQILWPWEEMWHFWIITEFHPFHPFSHAFCPSPPHQLLG